ncbi:hypothetical protein ES705_49911 [subsurface metagenome]
MIDAAFVSNSGKNQANIIRSHYKNLAGAFNHWNDKLALAFATVDGVEAKRFKDQVNNSKDNWATAVAQKTLRATGDKIRGTLLGQVLYWMTGDYRANQMTNGMEVVDGAPYLFTSAVGKATWKAGMMGALVRSMVTILDADFLAAEFTAQNSNLASFCTQVKSGGVKAFIQDGGALDSLFRFEYDDPPFLGLSSALTLRKRTALAITTSRDLFSFSLVVQRSCFILPSISTDFPLLNH